LSPVKCRRVYIRLSGHHKIKKTAGDDSGNQNHHKDSLGKVFNSLLMFLVNTKGVITRQDRAFVEFGKDKIVVKTSPRTREKSLVIRMVIL